MAKTGCNSARELAVYIESFIGFNFEDHNPQITRINQGIKQFSVVCHGGVIEAFYEYVFEKGSMECCIGHDKKYRNHASRISTRATIDQNGGYITTIALST